MSKRSLKSAALSSQPQPKQQKHWSLALLDSMKDPELIVIESKSIVVIKDKFPKAKLHFLALPHDNISSIYKLDKSHTQLLEEFRDIYEDLKEKHGDSLNAGFHAVPSMQRLHMHIISTDMISPCLKTKVHWNSFTTKFFIPLEDVIKELQENGSIKKVSEELHKSFMSTPFSCNQCTFKPTNMPKLKEHLLTHEK